MAIIRRLNFWGVPQPRVVFKGSLHGVLPARRGVPRTSEGDRASGGAGRCAALLGGPGRKPPPSALAKRGDSAGYAAAERAVHICSPVQACKNAENFDGEGSAALRARRDLKRREKSEAGCPDGRARRSPEEKSEPGAFRPKGQEGPRQEGGDSRRKRGRKREKGPPRPRGGPFKGRSTVG